MILIWFLSLVVVKDVNTWQLVINTVTTIITFLLVSLPQNTQRRTETCTTSARLSGSSSGSDRR